MNYRHAFHAGNFADVMKHVLLVRMLVHLRRKDTAFRVIDTHAGIGFYDLSAPEAIRTGEWRDGIGRLEQPFDGAVEELLQPYREILAGMRARHGNSCYPGSPAITRELLRRNDRAIFIEKHELDGELLRERFNTVRNTKVLRADGWAALGGLVPPKEKRGLVLIDPPYEEAGELMSAIGRLGRATRKWPTGVFTLWYPVKLRTTTDSFAAALSAALPAPAIRIELLIDAPNDPARLSGSGLVVVNPPWTLEAEAPAILAALAERLGRTAAAGFKVERLATPA